MSDLRQTIDNMRQGMTLLGFDAEPVNWQSIAVLLANVPGKLNRIRGELLNEQGGWATLGMARHSDGTSLYLSPKGMAYWLRYGGHYRLYNDMFGADQNKLDRAGWLHISGGRVDVYCAMTKAQETWLANHRPDPDSDYAASDGDWTLNDARDHTKRDRDWRSTHRAEPYAVAEPFDVRPTALGDIDWERLLLRIANAQEQARIDRVAD